MCRAGFRLGLAGILLALTTAFDTGSVSAQGGAAPPPAVLVAKAATREMQRESEYIGRVQAIEKVDVRARVTGFLIAREYKEGNEVKKGDVLFLIDPSQFEATLAQRQAALASAEAAALNAEQQLKRASELARTDFGTRQMLDMRTAEDAKAKADILGAKAQITLAEIDVGYTKITSPIDGRAGPAALTTGNLVAPDSGVLATVVSQDPIYVTFPITQRELLGFRQQGTTASEVKLRLRLVDGSLYDQTGTIAFTDVQFSQQTDTLTVRSTFPNPKRILIDGQSVRAVVATEAAKAFVTVPDESLQSDQAGTFVLVVDKDNKVEQRRVQIGVSRDGVVAITSGLHEGERVIVQGIQKVRPGLVVTASEAAPATGGRR